MLSFSEVFGDVWGKKQKICQCVTESTGLCCKLALPQFASWGGSWSGTGEWGRWRERAQRPQAQRRLRFWTGPHTGTVWWRWWTFHSFWKWARRSAGWTTAAGGTGPLIAARGTWGRGRSSRAQTLNKNGFQLFLKMRQQILLIRAANIWLNVPTATSIRGYG